MVSNQDTTPFHFHLLQLIPVHYNYPVWPFLPTIDKKKNKTLHRPISTYCTPPYFHLLQMVTNALHRLTSNCYLGSSLPQHLTSERLFTGFLRTGSPPSPPLTNIGGLHQLTSTCSLVSGALKPPEFYLMTSIRCTGPPHFVC